MCIPWQLFLEHQHNQPPRCRKQERSPADYRDFAAPWKTSGKRSLASQLLPIIEDDTNTEVLEGITLRGLSRSASCSETARTL
jgi:hypothetical protein